MPAPARPDGPAPFTGGAIPTYTAETLTLQHLSALELKQLLTVRGVTVPTGATREELLALLSRTIRQELPTECLWVPAPGESRRRGASCVGHAGAVWQFGGVDLEGVVYNTTHRWTPDDGWQLVDARGTLPKPRWTHSAVVHGSSMYIFGGFYGYGGSGSSGRLNDLWRLDLETLSWQEVTPGDGSAPPPAVRSHHSATVLRDRMYIFGGADEQRVSANGGRAGGGAGGSAFDWLTGGAGGSAAPAPADPSSATPSDEYVDILHNDLHEFEFATRKWRLVATSPLLPAPPGGITARLGVHRGLLYCLCWRALEVDEEAPYDLGVDAADGIVVEMAVIDPVPGAARGGASNPRAGVTRQDKLPAWRQVPFTGSPPRARDLFSSAVWQDSWIIHAGRSVRGELLRDTHEFNFESRTWAPLLGRTTGGPSTPDVRYGHCAVVIGNAMYVVGGSNAAQQAQAPRALTQRCAAVEQLFLRRAVAPADEYMPPIPVVPPRSPKQRALDAAKLTWRGMRWCGFAMARAAGYQVVWPQLPDPETVADSADRTPARKIITSDVNLLVDSRRFHTHSDILASSSERFAAILARDPNQVSFEAATQPLRRLEAWAVSRSGPPALLLTLHYLLVMWSLLVRLVLTARKVLFPKRPRRIVVRDVSYDVALVMMHYAYAAPTDVVAPVPSALLEDAYVASERYGMARMRAACIKQLIRGVTPATAARLAGLAQQYSAPELWDAAVRCAAKNLPEVVQGVEFANLWTSHGRVAQQLTADAAKEMQSSGRGGRQAASQEAAYVPPPPEAPSRKASGNTPGDVFLSARTVALDAGRSMETAAQALTGLFGGGGGKAVSPKATTAVGSNQNRARALR